MIGPVSQRRRWAMIASVNAITKPIDTRTLGQHAVGVGADRAALACHLKIGKDGAQTLEEKPVG